MHFRTSIFIEPYLYQFIEVMQKTDAGTAPSKGAIWDKSNEQNQHQSIKSTIFMPNSHFLDTN